MLKGLDRFEYLVSGASPPESSVLSLSARINQSPKANFQPLPIHSQHPGTLGQVQIEIIPWFDLVLEDFHGYAHLRDSLSNKTI